MNYTDNRKKYYSEIEEKISKSLKKSRWRHTQGVAHTAACLAMRYDEDIDKAYLAGLLHDIAKNLSDSEILKMAKKNHLNLSEFEKEHPYILHGKIGAIIASEVYKIKDEDILNAISFHTTGRPGMSLLEKIVFLADYIECGRDQASDLAAVRHLAFKDIEECILLVLKDTLEYLDESKMDIDDMTQNTYNYYTKEGR